jgi:hypothetical protein
LPGVDAALCLSKIEEGVCEDVVEARCKKNGV